MDLKLYRMSYMDSSYKHAPIFRNLKYQAMYFSEFQIYNIINCSYQSETGTIMVPKNKSELLKCDYLSYINMTENKIYYAFILGIEYVNDNLSNIVYEIDLIQTYMFDYTLKNCMVERMHVHRWNKDGDPYISTVPEGVEYGDNIEDYKDTPRQSIDINNIPAYIVVSSSPLGKINNWSGSGGNGETPSIPPNDNSQGFMQGVASAKLVRFIKGYEGYGKYEYMDPATTPNPTIGYGTTKSEPIEFNRLKALEPASEKECAITLNKLITKNYGQKFLNLIMKYKVNSQNRFDALVDLLYNSGPDALDTPTDSLPNALLNYPDDESKVRPIWEKYWNKDKLQGVYARRKSECNMWFNNVYDYRPIPIIDRLGKITGTLSGDGYMDFGNTGGSTSFPSSALFNNQFGSRWHMPCMGRVTCLYPSYSNGNYHNGTDIANSEGTPIYTCGDGVIEIRKELTTSYGKFLVIKHREGVYSLYAHNSKLLKNVGDRVKTGEKIAEMGTTGHSSGNHCHFSFMTAPPPTADTNYVEPIQGLKMDEVIKW